MIAQRQDCECKREGSLNAEWTILVLGVINLEMTPGGGWIKGPSARD